MSTADGNRFTYVTPDDHQRWLWFTHIYCPSIVILIGCLRLRRKCRRLGLDDALLLAAHVRPSYALCNERPQTDSLFLVQSLYLAYWLLALFALIDGLGKSENVTSPLERVKASKVLLHFISRFDSR
jgi:hypothetical protein